MTYFVLYSILRILLGMRKEEVRALRWGNLLYFKEAGCFAFNVCRSVDQNDKITQYDGMYLAIPDIETYQRIVSIPLSVVDIIKDFKKYIKKEHPEAVQKKAYVFSADGRPDNLMPQSQIDKMEEQLLALTMPHILPAECRENLVYEEKDICRGIYMAAATKIGMEKDHIMYNLGKPGSTMSSVSRLYIDFGNPIIALMSSTTLDRWAVPNITNIKSGSFPKDIIL